MAPSILSMVKREAEAPEESITERELEEKLLTTEYPLHNFNKHQRLHHDITTEAELGKPKKFPIKVAAESVLVVNLSVL